MAFRTVFSKHKRFFSNPGDSLINDYGFARDEKGEKVFKCIGKFDLYEKIQSFKDSCDIYKIIEKFLVSGDPSVLIQKQGFYADITEYPTSLADMLDKYEKAKELFKSLDPDVRAKFNNDPDQFYSSFGTEKFNSVFYNDVPVDNAVIKEEVKADE